MACVCHSLAASQRHTSSSLAAVIGLSNNYVISLRSFLTFQRCVRCVGWKPRFSDSYWQLPAGMNHPHSPLIELNYTRPFVANIIYGE